ncbi:MAG: tRNA (adenosine(37)-N6)-dimethylallyltransferase MiaA [Anaerosomatales bacterium]|nr:tRNA (adenosine(37)-N6)-dimethylallyltransferase MiaA [Anaerosomatales bacterium]MDT8433351.1 tRNA (adenosine(37)-N6)-dimethylallyltransferase MiaA [Anaerosomatales bacterium]
MSTATPDSTRHLRVIAIVGPTAVGKTALAEHLAVSLGGEIVSADSMQVYRGMDIGTAKPPAEARRVPYHCLDIVDPGTPFSAALYQHEAREAIARIARAGALPFVCGGTGLYVRAALDDWEFPHGEASTPERQALEREAAEVGPAGMHERLALVDLDSARLIHPSNVRRTIRALEMAALGDSYAAQAARFSVRDSVYDAVFLGLTMERERLYRHIETRVEQMVEAGLPDEVRSLLAAGFRDALTAAQAIGYKELVPVVEAGADLAEAIGQIKQATRRYAKRQLTWFRSDPRIRWIDATDRSTDECARAAFGLLESDEPGTGTPAPGTWRLTAD